jgi:hypothetical protein
MVQFPGSRFTYLCIQYVMTGLSPGRVTPFGNPRIAGCLLLPVAFRSLPRPSSPDSSEASTMNSFSLDHILSLPRRISRFAPEAPRSFALRNSTLSFPSAGMCPPGSSLSGLALLMCPVPSSQASFRVSPTALSHSRSHNTNGLVLPALFLSGSQISPLPLQVPRRTGTVHHRSLPLPYVCKRTANASTPARQFHQRCNLHGRALTEGEALFRP